MNQKIAVVTGGNRGIGLEICRQLAGAGLRVMLTSRDESAGRAAQIALAVDGVGVDYGQLDVTDEQSILRLRDLVDGSYGRLDALVNNAGLLLDRSAVGGLAVGLDIVEETVETNVYGPIALSQALIPLMQRNSYGRIVNMSSGMGQLNDMGGGFLAYRLSKTALNAVTRVLAAELAGTNILVNSMCPGWVRTDMGGSGAPKSVEEGADTATWLATLPDGGPTGGFFRDRKPIPW
jgi:NAD(P)-dependent dehydrogenase (short-subunit alcohol dehydrogenase family)